MATLERLQILVTPEQKRWLEAESARRGEPVTAVVREAIETARTRRSPLQRLDSLRASEAIWARMRTEGVTNLPIDDLNRLIDDGRLREALETGKP